MALSSREICENVLPVPSYFQIEVGDLPRRAPFFPSAVSAPAVRPLPGSPFALDLLGPHPLIPGRPTHTGLTLRYTVAQALPQGDHRITIYNLLGQRLPLGNDLYHWQKIIPVGEGSHDLFLDLPLMRQWPSGVYILRFTLERHSFTRTFTILR